MINPVARAARAVIGRATERQRLPDAAAILSALSVPVVLLDAENRIPGPCVACGFKKVGKVVLWTAIAGGLGYGGYLAYEHRQQVNGFSH